MDPPAPADEGPQTWAEDHEFNFLTPVAMRAKSSLSTAASNGTSLTITWVFLSKLHAAVRVDRLMILHHECDDRSALIALRFDPYLQRTTSGKPGSGLRHRRRFHHRWRRFALKGYKPMIAQMAKNARRVASRAAVAGLALLSASLPSTADQIQDPHGERTAAMTMQDDLRNRAPEIHWPQGFDPTTADLFSHNALLIRAGCERVWRHIVEAEKWPDWYPNAKDVRLVGDGGTVLKAESTFRWTTFGIPLESRINEFVPYTRIGWYGYAPGATPSFYHTWYLTPQGDDCLVVTDEVGKGRDAAQLRATDESLMHRGHDLWLATLKWVSEGK